MFFSPISAELLRGDCRFRGPYSVIRMSGIIIHL